MREGRLCPWALSPADPASGGHEDYAGNDHKLLAIALPIAGEIIAGAHRTRGHQLIGSRCWASSENKAPLTRTSTNLVAIRQRQYGCADPGSTCEPCPPGRILNLQAEARRDNVRRVGAVSNIQAWYDVWRGQAIAHGERALTFQ